MRKTEVNTSASCFNDALALVFQIDPDKIEDFNRLSDALAGVLANMALDEETVSLVFAAKDHVDRLIRGESSDAEEVLTESSRLLEAASITGGMELLKEPASEARTADANVAVHSISDMAIRVSEVLPCDVDSDLLAEFVTESLELLDNSESALLALESNPKNAEAVNTVFRAFHTIKGTSGFLGLKLTAELAHLAESLLTRVRSREIELTGGYADLALRAVDMLKKAVSALYGAPKGATYEAPAGFEELKAVLSRPVADQFSGSTLLDRKNEVQQNDGHEFAPDARPAVLKDAEYTSSIRVNIARLDRLIDFVGELVIAHSVVVQDTKLLADKSHDLFRKVARVDKIIRELQDLSMSMRMVPLRGTFQKMQRLARDLARKSGKCVDLIVDDGGTEIDRHMVAILNDVLLHMVRNAIDHGIESPDVREQCGKSPTGTVRLTASCSGGTVTVEMCDDGRGLNREKILRAAIAAGVTDPQKTLSDSEAFRLIFSPGLSTSEQVTDVSGRGVGMDVVRRGVESLHGRVEIQTAMGLGSTFTLRIPLTLAITDGMLVRVGSERYLIPIVSIHQCFRPKPESISTVAGRGELVLLRGEMLPLFRLHRHFGIRPAIENAAEGLLVVVGHEQKKGRCAILVDELLGQQQVVAKPLTKAVGKIPGISGGTILGDGQVGLILDTEELCQLVNCSALSAVGISARQPSG